MAKIVPGPHDALIVVDVQRGWHPPNHCSFKARGGGRPGDGERAVAKMKQAGASLEPA
ncbi:MAG TPA: hypothetical protein VLX30_11700 [Burkholderiales bacterium]|nr:hypothetical protein [Burkholderiales bacterium]